MIRHILWNIVKLVGGIGKIMGVSVAGRSRHALRGNDGSARVISKRVRGHRGAHRGQLEQSVSPDRMYAPAVCCPICGCASEGYIFEYRNVGPHTDRIFDGLSLRICSCCDSTWCPESPTNKQLSDYYASRYRPARMGYVERRRWPIWDTRAASLIMLARLFTLFNPRDLFVDVGPGNGAALSLAPMMLPSPGLACVEFNQQSIDFFRYKLPHLQIVHSIDDLQAGSATIVYSAHSLEHLRPEDALRSLRAIHRTLAPAGVLSIEVPLGSRARTKKRHAPHLLFFSANGLRRILTRAGFEIVLLLPALGRKGNARVAEHLQLPGELSRKFAARMTTLNTGDLLPATTADIPGAVIKCVAAKRDIVDSPMSENSSLAFPPLTGDVSRTEQHWATGQPVCTGVRKKTWCSYAELGKR